MYTYRAHLAAGSVVCPARRRYLVKALQREKGVAICDVTIISCNLHTYCESLYVYLYVYVSVYVCICTYMYLYMYVFVYIHKV